MRLLGQRGEGRGREGEGGERRSHASRAAVPRDHVARGIWSVPREAATRIAATGVSRHTHERAARDERESEMPCDGCEL
jgi:hypothetical protein